MPIVMALVSATANSRVFGRPACSSSSRPEASREFINSPVTVQRSAVVPAPTIRIIQITISYCTVTYCICQRTCHLLAPPPSHAKLQLHGTGHDPTATPFSFRTVLGRRVPKYPPPHGPVITLNSHPKGKRAWGQCNTCSKEGRRIGDSIRR